MAISALFLFLLLPIASTRRQLHYVPGVKTSCLPLSLFPSLSPSLSIRNCVCMTAFTLPFYSFIIIHGSHLSSDSERMLVRLGTLFLLFFFNFFFSCFVLSVAGVACRTRSLATIASWLKLFWQFISLLFLLSFFVVLFLSASTLGYTLGRVRVLVSLCVCECDQLSRILLYVCIFLATLSRRSLLVLVEFPILFVSGAFRVECSTNMFNEYPLET